MPERQASQAEVSHHSHTTSHERGPVLDQATQGTRSNNCINTVPGWDLSYNRNRYRLPATAMFLIGTDMARKSATPLDIAQTFVSSYGEGGRHLLPTTT